ncbi:toll/interleukin-1 receptor domain-containing protein [Thiothrix nivea]|uniref:TIR protein n=1 Tax=Thiothrix nivea (strain ATCC 35100 / DSM 5205 / JP2) TaxID=870187 RepID=A0A656HDZ1_THINJ|nr:toll/interleukin-1 receptor domain-containing protein [Thiothrix nivea]EIJ33255.1 TIR protein [Thiothrix nivea DSM 5205]
MSDIFISYSRRDKPWVETLAKALEKQGYDVWWDPEILPGQDFEEIIKAALNASRCVVTVWSKESVKSYWVKEESTRALARRILVPVLYQAVEPPMPFGRIHTADLTGWKGKETDPRFQQLLRAVALHCEPSAKPAAEEPPPPPSEPVIQHPQPLKPQFPEPVVARLMPEPSPEPFHSGDVPPSPKTVSFLTIGFFVSAIMLTTGALYANWDKLFGNVSSPPVETPAPPPPPEKPELTMQQVRECLKGKDEICWKPSLDWLEKKVTSGDGEAMHVLALAHYLEREGLKAEPKTYCDLFKRAIAAGYSDETKFYKGLSECKDN